LDYRFIHTDELHALIGGSSQMLVRRLYKLFHAGYVSRPVHQLDLWEREKGGKPFVHAFGDQLRRDLRDGVVDPCRLEEHGINVESIGKLDWTTKNRSVDRPYIEHTLMVTRFRVVINMACREDASLELLFWYQGRSLDDYVWVERPARKGQRPKRMRFPISPDAFFCVRVDGQRCFYFLEADRSTMPGKTSDIRRSNFFKKLLAYWTFWKDRRFKKEESPYREYKIRGLQVLTITRTPKRAENLRELSVEVDPRKKGLNLFAFTCEKNYSLEDPSGVFGEIWQFPPSGDKLLPLLD